MALFTDTDSYWAESPSHILKKRLLCEGDSWFSIPSIAHIPLQLEALLDASILCLADPGDTLEELTAGLQFKKIKTLLESERFGQKWDALLLSVGGNDVIGPEIRGLLNAPADPASTNPDHYLNQEAVEQMFAILDERLRKLIGLRDQSPINREMPIFIHTYSYLTPRNEGHKVLAWRISGPWIHRYMVPLGITDCSLQQAIVAKLLDGFHGRLERIADETNEFHVIDTRKSLEPVLCRNRKGSQKLWRDEIHPSRKGFARIAKSFFVPALLKAGVITDADLRR